MVKLYCPKCMDVYTPKSSRHHHTDGAYFGTGFPHMLFMVHPEYRPKRPANQFVPRYVVFLMLIIRCLEQIKAYVVATAVLSQLQLLHNIYLSQNAMALVVYHSCKGSLEC